MLLANRPLAYTIVIDKLKESLKEKHLSFESLKIWKKTDVDLSYRCLFIWGVI